MSSSFGGETLGAPHRKPRFIFCLFRPGSQTLYQSALERTAETFEQKSAGTPKLK